VISLRENENATIEESCSGQLGLLPTSIKAVVEVAEDHELVQLARSLDWIELERVTAAIREQKVKGPGGRIPHLRVMLGAMALMALRKKTYRETEDQLPYPTIVGLVTRHTDAAV
jgi:hypothetical protein